TYTFTHRNRREYFAGAHAEGHYGTGGHGSDKTGFFPSGDFRLRPVVPHGIKRQPYTPLRGNKSWGVASVRDDQADNHDNSSDDGQFSVGRHWNCSALSYC